MVPRSTWTRLHFIQKFTGSALQNAKLLGQSRFIRQVLQNVGQESTDVQNRLNAMVTVHAPGSNEGAE